MCRSSRVRSSHLLMMFTALLCTSAASWGLPSPWQHMDIGTSGGTASYSAPTFTLQGSGWDINSTSDGFGYVYQPLSGDGTIIARVASVQYTHWASKGGVMIRETLDAGSKHAAITITPSSTTAFQWRAATGGGTSEAAFIIGAPHFVKLVRSGNNFSAYESSDGSSWSQLGTTQTISMTTNVYVGMCVSSHEAAPCTATFDNVSVTSLPTVTLSRNNATIAEAAGVCTLTATLSATSSQTVTVDLGYSGTATQGTDYSAANSITINPGNLTGTTNITATQDTLYEGNETVIVDIASVTNGRESETQQVSTSITDDDSQPSVTLSRNNATIAEAAGVSTLTATLSNASTQAVTVNLGYTGTATSGTDYTAANAITVTAGNLTGTTNITATQDTLYEGNETVIVDITGVTNGTESGTQQVTVTITDDDTGGLPSPWQHMDIGTSGGTSSYAAPTFSIEGSGWDINSTSDGFSYVYQPLSGDGTIIVRVASVEDTHWAAKGGVMIREALTTGSKHAAITITPYATTAFQWRAATDGGTSEAAFIIGPPHFVKLVRSGSNFSAYESSDGSSWSQLGTTQTISMTTNVYVGMCVSSHAAALCTATFDNVSVTSSSPLPTVTLSRDNASIAEAAGVCTLTATLSATSTQNVTVNLGYTGGTATQGTDFTAANSITVTAGNLSNTTSITATQDSLVEGDETVSVEITSVTNGTESGTQQVSTTITDDDAPPGELPAPWQRTDIGTSGGTASYAAPTFTLVGNGWDINSTSDGFGYVYQPLSGDGTIIARVASVQYTHSAAKGSVMIREALTTGSKHAAITITPSSTTAFQWRAATDGGTSEAAFIIGPPHFVKLVRSGNNFTAYESSDGNTWSQLGTTQTISMTTNVYVGICVSSHDAALCTATFDNVSVTGGSGTDITAPAVVTSLATSSPTNNSITLTWTAPGDDGSTGTASTYDIRYSTSAINDGNWASATQVTGEPAPAIAGAVQSKVVDGLSASQTYYFALKTADEVPNWSGLSNPCPSGTTTGGTDGAAPATITDLAASNPTSSTIRLTWTKPGDDGAGGGAASTYDIRYRTDHAITTTNDWDTATTVNGEPTPSAPPGTQIWDVPSLSPNMTYWFAMKTADEVPNWSGLSNSPSGTTTSVPAGVLSPDDLTYVGCVMYPDDIPGTEGFGWNAGMITGRRVGSEIRLFIQMRMNPFMGYAEGAKIVEARYDGASPTVAQMRAQNKRLTTVRNWGDVYDGRRLNTGILSGNGLRTHINWHPTQQRLYWSYNDTYNAGGLWDPHFGFSTLDDATGEHSSYGPFRCNQYIKAVSGLQTMAPADWASTYTGGRRVLLGGMFTGAVSGCPFGANGYIINEPDTTTPPQTLTDYPATGFTTYKRLVEFGENNPMPVTRTVKACQWASPGNHTHLTAPFTPGQTTVSIDDTTLFYNTTARGSHAPATPENVCYGHIGPGDMSEPRFFYTGRSSSSGPGTLTGVTYEGSSSWPTGTQVTLGNYDAGRGNTVTGYLNTWGPLGAIYTDFMTSVAWVQTPTKRGVIYFGALVDRYPGATYQPAGEDCPHAWYGFQYCPCGAIGQYDPAGENRSSPGPSAGPYRQSFGWIFDPEDFGKVVNDQMNWQDVRAVHQFALNQPPTSRFPEFPGINGPEGNLWGAWFEETSRLLFVAFKGQDSWTNPYEGRPVIHVFQVP